MSVLRGQQNKKKERVERTAREKRVERTVKKVILEDRKKRELRGPLVYKDSINRTK